MRKLRGLRFLISCCLLSCLLTGCAATGPGQHGLRQPITLGRAVLVAPPDLTVRFRAAPDAPTLPDPRRSERAKRHVLRFLDQHWSTHGAVKVLSTAELSGPGVAEHLALYYQVAAQAFDTMESQDPRWQHKKSAPDYSIGPGLKQLGDQQQAQFLLVIVGQQTRAPFALKLLDSDSLVPAALTAGLIDLQSGRIVWLNYVEPGGRDLHDRTDAESVLADLLDGVALRGDDHVAN